MEHYPCKCEDKGHRLNETHCLCGGYLYEPCGQKMYVCGLWVGTCVRERGIEHDHNAGPQLVVLG